MEIELKQIIKDTQNEQIIAFFDVIDGDNYWVDPNNRGYFPITYSLTEPDNLDLDMPIESKISKNDLISIEEITDANIKDKCREWIIENDILNKYRPIENGKALLELKDSMTFLNDIQGKVKITDNDIKKLAIILEKSLSVIFK